MGILESATTAGQALSKALDNVTPAGALEGIKSAVSGVTSVVSNILSPVGLNLAQIQAPLPLANPLNSFASYNTIFTLSVLDADTYNFPDKTYMQGRTSKGTPLPIILRSGSGQPDNRINTIYGKYDFHIDDVVIESQIGWEKSNNTNAVSVNFRVTEPYSLGLFMMSLQQAAYEAGHKNWRDAPFLLTIEFMGANQIGIMQQVPNTKRCIPLKFVDIVLNADVNGSKYECKCLPYNEMAYGKSVAGLKNDVSVSGTTVQEVLQTGPKSLQAVINRRYKQMVEDDLVEEPDEIVILFPVDVSSNASAETEGEEESDAGATTGSAGPIEKKLGLSRSTTNDTLVQKKEQINAIGQAKLGFDNSRKGDTPMAKDNAVYDTQKGIFVRGNITIDPSASDFKFRQDTDVINAINQVIMASNYAKDALDPVNLTKEGFREWWRVETQIYVKDTDANDTSTGVKPKIYVYRVVPYKAHSSKVLPANTTAPGMEELKKQAVKRYEYLYLGTNTEVRKFEIQFSSSFTSVLAADGGLRSQDVKTVDQAASSDNTSGNINPLPKGDAPASPSSGAVGSQVSFSATSFKTDKLGGGGSETAATRAARLFHDAITSGVEMMNIDLEINGDPYFIAQSGTGNYTSQGTQYVNLNKDASVNYQNGEVDIEIAFRTPKDINQATGLYNFGAPTGVAQFTGLYQITNVTSTFKGGQFTQRLLGLRRKGQPQDNPTSTPSAQKTFNSANPSQATTVEQPVVPGGDEGE